MVLTIVYEKFFIIVHQLIILGRSWTAKQTHSNNNFFFSNFFFPFFFYSIVHEMHFNDRSSTLLCHCSWTFILSRSWTAKKSTPPTISLVEWIFFAVHERAFYGPLWTKSLAKSLFLVVHERLYGIVHQHAFIPRCWTHPNSLADYLPLRLRISPISFLRPWISP